MSRIRVFSKTENFIFYTVQFICLIIIFLGLYKFHEVFFIQMDQMNQTPVASVSSCIKLSRRSFEKRTTWDLLRKDSLIYDGDIIRTDSNSQTTIVFFEDGLELTLTENTMTKISVGKDNHLNVNLMSGNILVDSMQKNVSATVNYNQTQISLTGKALISAAEIPQKKNAYKKDDPKQLEVHVLDGTINIVSGNEINMEVETGKMVTIVPNSISKTEQSNAGIFSREVVKEYDQITMPESIEKNQDAAELVILTEETNHLYGVLSQDNKLEFNQEFTELTESTLETESIEEIKEPTAEKYSFDWTVITSPENQKKFQDYIDNVYSDETDKEEEKTESLVKGTDSSSEPKASGSKSNNTGSKSENKSAQANKASSAANTAATKKLAEITSLKPSAGKTLTDEFFINNTSINFSWSAVKGATHYEFILVNSKGKVIDKIKVKANSYSFTKFELLEIGTFTWQVKALKSLGNGKYEDLSTVKKATFTIKLGEISGDASTTETNYKTN